MDPQSPHYSCLPASPDIRISRPDYASLPSRTSDESTDSRRGKPASYSEAVDDPGLGIQMMPIPSPKSSGSTYWRQDTPNTKSGAFSPPTYSPGPGPRPPYSRTPDTLYSFGSGISRARTDPMTERLIAHRATQSTQWRVNWRGPAFMVFAFTMGIVFALLQHFLYTFLHHQREEDEDKKFRWVLYGRALAYLSKLAFGGCVVLVFRQRMWRAFRNRAFTVLSIDQIFGATEDPSIFGNWEALSSAPVLCAIALVSNYPRNNCMRTMTNRERLPAGHLAGPVGNNHLLARCAYLRNLSRQRDNRSQRSHAELLDGVHKRLATSGEVGRRKQQEIDDVLQYYRFIWYCTRVV